MSDLPEATGPAILDALAHKDTARVADLVRDAKPPSAIANALTELPALHGDGGV